MFSRSATFTTTPVFAICIKTHARSSSFLGASTFAQDLKTSLSAMISKKVLPPTSSTFTAAGVERITSWFQIYYNSLLTGNLGLELCSSIELVSLHLLQLCSFDLPAYRLGRERSIHKVDLARVFIRCCILPAEAL